MPAGGLTPGNWTDRVWFQQNFRAVPFNGTRQLMRATAPEGERRSSLGTYVARTPKYRTHDGATYIRRASGQVVRTTPRRFKHTRRVRGLISA